MIRRHIPFAGLNPSRCNIALDANALDRSGGPGDALIDRLLTLQGERRINFVVPDSVLREVKHPRTPVAVKATFEPQIYTIPVQRTVPELARLQKVRKLLQGNAAPGKHAADADHLFEAAKYGGGYFITNDQRMLNNRYELRELLGTALNIVTVVEFLEVYGHFNDRADGA